jgi:RNA 2',3'-cyclic 3'-phosphodiesterase
MSTARLFLALDLGPDLRRRLADCLQQLRPVFGDVKWVRPEAMHLTLHFLGDTPLARQADLGLAVSTAVAGQPPVPGVVKGLGVFPNPRRPTVVWAGITEGSDALGRLAERLRGALVEAGFPAEERPFSAHVTLGRIRGGMRLSPAALAEVLATWAETPFGSLAGDQVTLYASTLTPAGPSYEALRVWPLTAAAPGP